jgi:hypothetical protein
MAPVLVRGESGTGKELAARAVHACSHRSDGPFVAVNCGAIPEALLEAEFFGARKGSYTGATADRDGYFQAAEGGTLFLDEIGDLPLAMQSKLLRAIQERRCGPSVRPRKTPSTFASSAPPIATWHADVHAGRFRQDLYYRLNVIEIAVPPLRERRDDLPALCQALLARIAQDGRHAGAALSPTVVEQLAAHPLARQRARTREPAAPRRRPVRWPGAAGRRHRRRRAASLPLSMPRRRRSAAQPKVAPLPAVRPAGLPRPAGARDPGARTARDRLQPHGRRRSGSASACARSATASRGWPSPCPAATNRMTRAIDA